jgi:hypothetical protein
MGAGQTLYDRLHLIAEGYDNLVNDKHQQCPVPCQAHAKAIIIRNLCSFRFIIDR